METEILTSSTAHLMYDSKRKMTVGYATRMTRSHGHWLDVVFIFDEIDQQNNASPTTESECYQYVSHLITLSSSKRKICKNKFLLQDSNIMNSLPIRYCRRSK